MHKELIISIVIIIGVVILNNITQANTDITVEQMKQYLDSTKAELTKEQADYVEASRKAKEAHDKWEELDDKIALYVEHNEIEKVSTAITSMQSSIQMEDDSQAVDSIDRCKYILDHIDEREKFTIDNIF